MKINISKILLILFLGTLSSTALQSCKGTKKDCDCPTFGKKQKQKKTRYKKR